jgi:hypothetical protein
VLSPLAGLLRLASFLLCLIVIVSFALFAINQTGNASTHQQRELNNEPTTSSTNEGAPSKGSARERIDEASEAVTSPFDAATNGMSSQWAIRGTDLALALVVYGFGLGFIARMIRVRL